MHFPNNFRLETAHRFSYFGKCMVSGKSYGRRMINCPTQRFHQVQSRSFDLGVHPDLVCEPFELFPPTIIQRTPSPLINGNVDLWGSLTRNALRSSAADILSLWCSAP